MNFQKVLDITKDIPSAVSDIEAKLLYALAEETHHQDGTVVEIGAYQGKSTIILAATGLVYSIDHHRGSPEHQIGQVCCRPGTVVDGKVDTYPLFKSFVERSGLWNNVIPIVTDHLSALSYLDQSVFPISLLFIDAEHSYDTTTSIIHTWIPHTKGIVLFHDYHKNFPGLIRAVDEAELGSKIYKVDTIVGFDTKNIGS